jgi:hypothetical protein
MRARIFSLFLTVSLVSLSLPATAAPIEIVVSRIGTTTNWSMSLNVAPGYAVGSLIFATSPPITDFEFNLANPTVSPPDSIFILDLFGDGRGVLLVNDVFLGNGTGVAMSGLLGTLHSTTSNPALIQLTEDLNDLGDAVYDTSFLPLPSSLWTVRVVPEPGAAWLLALAASALASARCRSQRELGS